MKVTPQIGADFEDYPELGALADSAIRRVVELMQIHDIADLRRIKKTGVFDHQYDKDIVAPIGVPTVPNTVAAARYAVGSALLDYLDVIGIRGISLEVTQDEVKAIAALWMPRTQQPTQEQPKDLTPEKVDETTPAEPETTPETPLKEPITPDGGEEVPPPDQPDPLTPLDASGKPAEPLMKKQEG